MAKGPRIQSHYVGGPERTAIVTIDGVPYRYRGVGMSAYEEFLDDLKRNRGKALAYLKAASLRGGGSGGERLGPPPPPVQGESTVGPREILDAVIGRGVRMNVSSTLSASWGYALDNTPRGGVATSPPEVRVVEQIVGNVIVDVRVPGLAFKRATGGEIGQVLKDANWDDEENQAGPFNVLEREYLATEIKGIDGIDDMPEADEMHIFVKDVIVSRDSKSAYQGDIDFGYTLADVRIYITFGIKL